MAGRLECDVGCFASLGDDKNFHGLRDLPAGEYGRIEDFPILQQEKNDKMKDGLLKWLSRKNMMKEYQKN